jgi:predicted dehydrogenase
MSDPLQLGVVGAGSISLRGLLPHLTMDDVQDRVRVVAVCDPAPGRAEAAAEKFGVPAAFRTCEELLDKGGVDAVTIASPIGVHFEQGMMAVERGVHAHFNKTMTTTADEADELIAAAEAAGVRLVASPGEMLRPLHREVRRLVGDGALGTLTWAVAGSAFGTYHENEDSVRAGDDVLTNVNPSWYWRRPGGGPLYDMTVYGLHALTGILGPARRVTAFSGVRIPERTFRGETFGCDMDDNTLILLDYGDSLFAFVYGVAAGHLPGTRRMLIFGTGGFINGDTLNGEPIDYPGREQAERLGRQSLLPHVTGEHAQMQEAHVYEDVMQLVDWVLDDSPSIVTAEHARHVIEVFDAAYRSAESGRAQDLRTTFPTLD